MNCSWTFLKGPLIHLELHYFKNSDIKFKIQTFRKPDVKLGILGEWKKCD